MYYFQSIFNFISKKRHYGPQPLENACPYLATFSLYIFTPRSHRAAMTEVTPWRHVR